jgi:DNA-binding transcriptional ArsR family regulator
MAYFDADLHHLFHALADPTRLAVVEALCIGPAPVTTLAAPHDMALPSFLKHLRVLESAGVVTTAKTGRVRQVTLRPAALQQAQDWFRDRHALWNRRLDRIGDILDTSGDTE